jgi:hypothetical protein
LLHAPSAAAVAALLDAVITSNLLICHVKRI